MRHIVYTSNSVPIHTSFQEQSFEYTSTLVNRLKKDKYRFIL